MNVATLNINDPSYPSLLKNIFDPPKTLYILGNENVFNNCIAVVGARKMTKRGEEAAKKIVKEFVKKGYVIVSGMALGIDGVAHKTAIENGGKTVAVLGCGIDVIYPPENRELYFKILKSGGAIISEIPNGHRVQKQYFASRNRIVSGLSQAVIIIEAEIKSGTLITARLALEQGREVYAVAGSAGTDYLIAQGANAILGE